MTKTYLLNYLTTNLFSAVLGLLALLFPLGCSTNSSNTTNKEVVQRWFDMVNKHDLTEMKEVFAADYIWHTMDGKDIHSSQDSSHIVLLKSVLSNIPNSNYKIVSIISEGDIVAVNTIVTGTAQIPLGQKDINVKQMFFYRLTGGLITEEWEVLDTDLLMKQMGRICPD